MQVHQTLFVNANCVLYRRAGSVIYCQQSWGCAVTGCSTCRCFSTSLLNFASQQHLPVRPFHGGTGWSGEGKSGHFHGVFLSVAGSAWSMSGPAPRALSSSGGVRGVSQVLPGRCVCSVHPVSCISWSAGEVCSGRCLPGRGGDASRERQGCQAEPWGCKTSSELGVRGGRRGR